MINYLKNIKHEITQIDYDILKLINNRTKLVRELTKNSNAIDSDIDDVIKKELEYIIENNKYPFQEKLVKEVFHCIMDISLRFLETYYGKDLLISSNSVESFYSINELFNLPFNELAIMAGPCAIENFEYLNRIARFLKEKGVKFIRGGAYKSRTSPYDFQGLGLEGLKILRDVANEYGLYSITEVTDTRDIELVKEHVNILQIGARNMYNYELLKAVGQTKHPILLKRGLSATINEFMLAAEYIVLQGNKKVIMCERGIRTYETKTRNTLDIAAIPLIKRETKLPIIVDLSHSLGRKDIINNIAYAVVAAGADGIMVEVHPHPEKALSDEKQQLNLFEFDGMLSYIGKRKL